MFAKRTMALLRFMIWKSICVKLGGVLQYLLKLLEAQIGAFSRDYGTT